MKHIHGGNIYQYSSIMDFSANINPLGMPESVRAAIDRSAVKCLHYPDPGCEKLREAIALAEQTRKEAIICGNGAAELIYLLSAAIKPKRVLLTAPSFAEYEESLVFSDPVIDYYPLKAENGFLLEEDYLTCITKETDMAFLCNPNNPTGILIRQELLNKIIDKCNETGTLLVLDECFLDFCEEQKTLTMTKRLPEGNLFILKAFTKIYAMPGVRLGYGQTTRQGLLDSMNQYRQPWSISVVAGEAGLAALSETDFVEKSVAFVKKEREFLIDGLKKNQLLVFGGSANFLFFQCDKQNLPEKLEKKGILIRDCSNYHGLEKGYYRIAVRTHEENLVFLEALNAILKEKE